MILSCGGAVLCKQFLWTSVSALTGHTFLFLSSNHIASRFVVINLIIDTALWWLYWVYPQKNDWRPAAKCTTYVVRHIDNTDKLWRSDISKSRKKWKVSCWASMSAQSHHDATNKVLRPQHVCRLHANPITCQEYLHFLSDGWVSVWA